MSTSTSADASPTQAGDAPASPASPVTSASPFSALRSLSALLPSRGPPLSFSSRFAQVGVATSAVLLLGAVIFQWVSLGVLLSDDGDLESFTGACLLAPVEMASVTMPGLAAMALLASFGAKRRFRASTWFGRSLGFAAFAALMTAVLFVAEEGTASEVGGLAFIFAPIVLVVALIFLLPSIAAVVGALMMLSDDAREPKRQPKANARDVG